MLGRFWRLRHLRRKTQGGGVARLWLHTVVFCEPPPLWLHTVVFYFEQGINQIDCRWDVVFPVWNGKGDNKSVKAIRHTLFRAGQRPGTNPRQDPPKQNFVLKYRDSELVGGDIDNCISLLLSEINEKYI